MGAASLILAAGAVLALAAFVWLTRRSQAHASPSRAGKAPTAGHGSVPHDPAAPPGRLTTLWGRLAARAARSWETWRAARDSLSVADEAWQDFLTGENARPLEAEPETAFWPAETPALAPGTDRDDGGGEAGHPGNDGRQGTEGDPVPPFLVPPVASPTPAVAAGGLGYPPATDFSVWLDDGTVWAMRAIRDGE